MWQDIVIAVVSGLFAVMLIPQLLDAIKGKRYVNKITAGFTNAGLLVICITFGTMEMWFSSVTAGITCFMWGLLFMFSFNEEVS